jgi:putative ABC transport system permease protein
MKLRHYTFRELVRRPGRTLLTLGGIVIGVAGVFAISLTINTTRHAYRQMFANLTGEAALEVVAEGGGGFDPAVAADVATVPGVRQARPIVQMVGAIVTDQSPMGVMVVGSSAGDDGADQSRLVAGRECAADNEIVLVDNFARGLKLSVGSPVRLLSPSGVREFHVVGLVEPSGVAGFNGGAVVFVSLPAADALFKLENQVTAVTIVLAGRANAEAIRSRIAGLLPAGLAVRSPATRGELAQHSLIGAEQGLATLSAVSIVAGAFVILNSFLMSLGERRRQLAILRAIGVTRGDVTRLLVREAFLLGLMGMVLGVAVGLATSVALTRGMGKLLGITLRELDLTAEPFLLAAVFGPGMAVLATLAPARRAAARPLLVDLLGLQTFVDGGMRRRMLRVGVALGSVSVGLIFTLVAGWMPAAIGTRIPAPLMGLFLVSGILLAPAVYPYISRWLAWLLRPVWGIEGGLAVRQLELNATRSSLTAAVLCVALMISISMGQSIRNNIRDIEEWSARTFTADFLLRGTLPELSYSIGVQLPETLRGELLALPGVASVQELNLVQAKAAGEPIVVLARSFDAAAAATLDIADRDRAAAIEGLLAGQAVVGTALAQRQNLAVGDWLVLRTRHGEKSVRIAGTVTEYVAGGMAVYLERETARRLFSLNGVDIFMVTASEGSTAELTSAMQQFADSRGLLLQSNAEFRGRIRYMIGGVVGFLWLLMGLVFVVASLGIVNTLTMNVLEQTREIAVLRSVAMLRRQVRAVILYQALNLALGSLVPGVGLGLLLAYLMNLSTHALLGQLVEFQADWWFAAVCGVACLAIACCAAWFPARRASRLEIVRALQYE